MRDLKPPFKFDLRDLLTRARERLNDRVSGVSIKLPFLTFSVQPEATEYKASEPVNSASTDDESERMNPTIEKFMNNSALIYLLTALFISIFDIGNLGISAFYCDLVKSLVPSLYGTSLISKDPNNTCLILALSWTWPFVTAGLMLKWLIEQLVDGSVTQILPQGKLFLRLLVFLLVMAGVVGLLHYIPEAKPGGTLKTQIIYISIKKWAFGSALLGVGIYYTIIVMIMIVISFVLEFIDKRKKGGVYPCKRRH